MHGSGTCRVCRSARRRLQALGYRHAVASSISASRPSARQRGDPRHRVDRRRRVQRIELKLDRLLERLGDAPAGGGRSGDADTTVDGAAGMAPVPAALVDDLRLAKSSLAGLSERVESLEQLLSEKFKPIDEAAQSVRGRSRRRGRRWMRRRVPTRGRRRRSRTSKTGSTSSSGMRSCGVWPSPASCSCTSGWSSPGGVRLGVSGRAGRLRAALPEAGP